MKNKQDLLQVQNAPEKVGKNSQLTTPPSQGQQDQLEKLSESELALCCAGYDRFYPLSPTGVIPFSGYPAFDLASPPVVFPR